MSDKCFVLMPFSEPFNEYYKTVLAPAIRAAGFEPKRADEIYGTHAIIEDIFKEIREATALVADVTGKNPNVNYELGIAHALNRPVVIISQLVSDIPFDYRHLRAIIYDTTRVNWSSELSDKITRTLLNIEAQDLLTANTQGIKQIHTDRTSINFLRLIQATGDNNEIKMLGITIRALNDHFIRDAINERLRAGCQIKILLLHRDSVFGKIRAMEEGRIYEEWKAELARYDDAHKDFIRYGVPEDIRHRIEIRHYDNVPIYSTFSNGKTMVVGFFGPGQVGVYSPHLELEMKKGGMYKHFEHYFDSLWEKGQ